MGVWWRILISISRGVRLSGHGSDSRQGLFTVTASARLYGPYLSRRLTAKPIIIITSLKRVDYSLSIPQTENGSSVLYVVTVITNNPLVEGHYSHSKANVMKVL